MKVRHLAAGLLALVAVGSPGSRAVAGNDDGVPVGNDAALMGHAAVANAGDASASFYNPAALGGVSRPTANLTASALHLRLSRSPDLVATPAAPRPVRATELISIPSAVAFARPLGPNLRLGLGLFIPESQRTTLRLDAEEEAGERETSISVTIAEERAVYRPVAALAWRASPSLWLGLSLRAGYVDGSGNAQFDATRRTPEGAGLLLLQLQGSEQRASLAASLGAHWTPGGGVTLACSVTTPEVALLSMGDFTATTGAASTTGGDETLGLETTSADETALLFEAVRAPFLRLGAQLTRPRFRLAIDVELHSPLENRDLQVDRAAFWNIRLGGEARVAGHVWLGGGLFTDRSPNDGGPTFATTDVDFYGATAGVRWSTRHVLGDEEEADEIVFGTTIALRYAYGRGEIGGLLLDAGSDSLVEDRVADVRVHELGLHLGSTLTF